MIKSAATVLSAVLVTTFVIACAPAPDASTTPGNDTIRQEELRADLEFLAGDGMRGRGPESAENALAAEFIKARFQRLGLEPAADDGSYYQGFELITTSLGAANSLSATIDGRSSAARMGADVTPMNFSGSASGRGELLLAGFGLVSESLDYDDYDGVDATGKVVLVFDHEPGEFVAESPFDGLVRSEVSRELRKALMAQERGAVGILFVGDVHNHEPAGGPRPALGRPSVYELFTGELDGPRDNTGRTDLRFAGRATGGRRRTRPRRALSGGRIGRRRDHHRDAECAHRHDDDGRPPARARSQRRRPVAWLGPPSLPTRWSSSAPTTTTTAPTATESTTVLTTMALARSACSRSQKRTPWPPPPVSDHAGPCCSQRGTRKRSG